MTDGDYLLREILTRPEDDLVRLAYADWLDENGGNAEHAEYIRLSVADHPLTGPRRYVLRNKLTDQLKCEQFSIRWCIWDKGFIRHIGPDVLPKKHFLGPQEIFKLHPVEFIHTPIPAANYTGWRRARSDVCRWSQNEIPQPIFDRMSTVGTHIVRGREIKDFNSYQEARDTLSLTWVNYLRETATLPPLQQDRRFLDLEFERSRQRTVDLHAALAERPYAYWGRAVVP